MLSTQRFALYIEPSDVVDYDFAGDTVQLLYSPDRDTFTLMPPYASTLPSIPDLPLSDFPSDVQQRVAALDLVPFDVAVLSVGMRRMHALDLGVIYYVAV